MAEVTIHEAKTQLSELVKRVQRGEEIIVTSGRARKPVMRMVAIEEPPKGRPIGLMKGMFELGPEFFEPLPEDELRLWNGEGE
jgi:prevent-host-death family protein